MPVEDQSGEKFSNWGGSVYEAIETGKSLGCSRVCDNFVWLGLWVRERTG